MTIKDYRYRAEVSYPTNGDGLQLPQLIDDLWNAREAVVWLYENTKNGLETSVALETAIDRLNRALTQLGIELDNQ